ncbi:battenin [Chelonus insularis]|uniref:battenin n=1 Tax=Chelonus insularis TaxID=460826 RepID=UPI00158E25C3|nr:battenin [Chelonus insularis]
MNVVKASHTIKGEMNETQAMRWRNFLAFWILGLCNNYGYVVMLSAAHDILKDRFEPPGASKSEAFTNFTIENPRGCNEVSTGAILLADIMPCLLIKITVPFLPFFVNFRLALCIIAQIMGFLSVAFATTPWLTILGVILTSVSSGLGEVTLISYSHKYGRESIAAWSSGTGGAGIAGAFSYAGMRMIMNTEQTLLVMLLVPAMEAIAFWFILPHPKEQSIIKYGISSQEEIIAIPKKSISEKFQLVPGLLIYIIPLSLVYLFEYFINQGLHELIQFDNIWLNYADQYRWLQVDYQIGVFISRSSASFITFKRVWLMAVLQFLNIILFATEAIFFYMPSIWIVFGLTLWEGLLGGAAYVNTFINMAETIPAEDLKDSLGIATMADSLGITLAGWLSMLVHAAICRIPRPIR